MIKSGDYVKIIGTMSRQGKILDEVNKGDIWIVRRVYESLKQVTLKWEDDSRRFPYLGFPIELVEKINIEDYRYISDDIPI